jgi:hypothetical protein
MEQQWRKSSKSAARDCVEMSWTKSSFCQNLECVEFAFQKSTFTNPDACVEADIHGRCGIPHLRDSKDPGGVILDYPAAEWAEGRVVQFEPVSTELVPERLRDVRASRTSELLPWYRVTRDGLSLYFDAEEKAAWLAGVAASEFALASMG